MKAEGRDRLPIRPQPSRFSLEEGDVAQMGERRLCTAEARSSNLLISTARQLWAGSILTSSDAAEVTEIYLMDASAAELTKI